MSVFQSTTHINAPSAKVYQFLADMNNHQQLMGDKVQDWVSTQEQASFNIQNMIKLSLKFGELIENTTVQLIPAEKPPFDLELKWELAAFDAGTTVIFTINAELSMMLKMVASGPLQKLADQETQNLGSIFA